MTRLNYRKKTITFLRKAITNWFCAIDEVVTFSEGKLEGKLDSISNLIKLGLIPEQVAIALNIDLKLVKKVSKFNQN
jgi:hypothetical protein